MSQFYYLRKESETKILKGPKMTDGRIIPDRTYETGERAIFKHHDFYRFYRGDFISLSAKYKGMKVYTCKTLKRILNLQKETFRYCNEVFDVYDENGKVDAISDFITKALAEREKELPPEE